MPPRSAPLSTASSDPKARAVVAGRLRAGRRVQPEWPGACREPPSVCRCANLNHNKIPDLQVKSKERRAGSAPAGSGRARDSARLRPPARQHASQPARHSRSLHQSRPGARPGLGQGWLGLRPKRHCGLGPAAAQAVRGPGPAPPRYAVEVAPARGGAHNNWQRYAYGARGTAERSRSQRLLCQL